MAIERLRTRRSTTKAVPAASDLELSEQGYSFLSNLLYIRNQVTGEVDCIGGKAIVEQVQALTAQVAGINKLPTLTPDSVGVMDDATQISGNVLTNDSDPEGGSLTVTSFRYAGITRSVGTSVGTDYGTFSLSASGAWTFAPGAAARALAVSQQATEQITYYVVDANGGSQLSNLTIQITGKNGAPVVNGETSFSKIAEVGSGNLLSNDADPEGGALSIVSFSVDGVSGTFSPGSSATVPGLGAITVAQNGAWSRSLAGATSAGTIVVRYTVSDGVNVAPGSLVLIVQSGVVQVGANPVTAALTGTRTFNVGPGQTYAELDTVPWSTLVAGDVVNIYWRATPYVGKFAVCAQGEANNPVIINGVTDASGNRPQITGAGARTASGCMPGGSGNIFSPGDEAFGVVVIKRKPGTSSSTNPRWITVQNLEITGAASGQAFQNADGSAGTYGFSAGIWVQPAADITLRNNKIYSNSNGIFTMAKVGGIGEQCQRISILYNHCHLNGTAGNGTEHNAYIQGYNNTIEGNYFGWLVNGSSGSSCKTRGSQEIIRYNWIDAGARALDLVQPDGIFDGFVAFADFGIDYVYGNVIVNDSARGGGSYRTVHYGGDNEGELDPAYGGGNSPVNYRKHLYFFNNTVFHAHPTSQSRQYFLQLSWQDTVADLWNNIIVFRGTGSTIPTLLYWAGILNFRGSNLVVADKPIEDRAPDTLTTYAVVNRIGSVVTLDPQFSSEAAYDFSLAAGSPALDLSSSLPVDIPASIGTNYPVEAEPSRQMNGIFARSTIGAMDLGALERDPSAPARNKPSVLIAPQYTSTSAFAVGSTVGVIAPAWAFAPTSTARQWQRLNGAIWEDIVGETGATMVLLVSHLPQIRCRFTAANSVGPAYVETPARTVTTQAAATILQFGFGSNEYPATPYNSVVAFAEPPVVGSLLVAFFTGGDAFTVTDNYGNTWVQQLSLQGNPSYGRQYRCFTCVVTSSGAGFVVTGNTTARWSSSLGVYEVDGTLAGVYGEVNNNLTVTYSADSVNQRILAGFSNEGYPDTVAGAILPPYVQDQAYLYGTPAHTLVHGTSIDAGPNTITIDHQYGDQMGKIVVRVNPR